MKDLPTQRIVGKRPVIINIEGLSLQHLEVIKRSLKIARRLFKVFIPGSVHIEHLDQVMKAIGMDPGTKR